MRDLVQLIRSVIFIVQMYLAMAIFAIFLTPRAIISRQGAFDAVHFYCRYVRWTASWMVGLRSEVRGEAPQDLVLIASKHQSFFDIIILISALPRPRFIMKKQLKWAPILGWYALRIGCVPVDRGKRGRAIQQMVSDVEEGRDEGGQLVIYPQGTRVAPGVDKPYKIGTGVLYEQLGQDCVPAATNVGVFWPRRGMMRKPGLAVIEFLPRIPAGLLTKEFMERLEADVEAASNSLMAEAGFGAGETNAKD